MPDRRGYVPPYRKPRTRNRTGVGLRRAPLPVRPFDIDAGLEAVARRERARAQHRDQMESLVAWQISNPCTTCGAEAGVPCHTLGGRRSVMHNPHMSRRFIDNADPIRTFVPDTTCHRPTCGHSLREHPAYHHCQVDGCDCVLFIGDGGGRLHGKQEAEGQSTRSQRAQGIGEPR